MHYLLNKHFLVLKPLVTDTLQWVVLPCMTVLDLGMADVSHPLFISDQNSMISAGCSNKILAALKVVVARLTQLHDKEIPIP